VVFIIFIGKGGMKLNDVRRIGFGGEVKKREMEGTDCRKGMLSSGVSSPDDEPLWFRSKWPNPLTPRLASFEEEGR
jgi:hypothetical protein